MGRLFLVSLDGNSYCCTHCMTPLALCDDVVSQSYQSDNGIAYLFSKVVNVYAGKKENWNMTTGGMHTYVEIYCVKCGSFVGWRYEFAVEQNQKYKEEKSFLERHKILGPEDLVAGDNDTDET